MTTATWPATWSGRPSCGAGCSRAWTRRRPTYATSRPCAGCRTADADLPLPGRLTLFGHTRIPVTEVELLQALGAHRDVHLFLPQVSPTLWDDLAGIGGVVAREDDNSAELVGHPLLASLGRDARELRRTLDGIESEVVSVSASVDAPDTLLGWLQQDLRANHAPSYDERAGRHLAAGDHSLQVHACHGAARQIDVLREVLVGMLQDDPTLEPRDILVMCPDIETFAPLISAGFGLATTAGTRPTSCGSSSPTAPSPAPTRCSRWRARCSSSPAVG